MTLNGPDNININDHVEGDTSIVNIAQSTHSETMPDGDSEIFQLFTAGDKLKFPREPGREYSEESEKRKTISTKFKLLSLKSKVGHISEGVESSKQNLPASHEKSSVESGTNGKATTSAKYLWVSIKRKLSMRRGSRQTSVKEIHIPPEQGLDMWVSRSQDRNQNTSNTGSTCSSREGSSASRINAKEENKDLGMLEENRHSLHRPHER